MERNLETTRTRIFGNNLPVYLCRQNKMKFMQHITLTHFILSRVQEINVFHQALNSTAQILLRYNIIRILKNSSYLEFYTGLKVLGQEL